MANNKYITFLNKLADLLSKNTSIGIMSDSVVKLFKNYLEANSINFIIWDDNNMILRDFVREWETYEQNSDRQGMNNIYNNLVLGNGKYFNFNGEEFVIDTDIEKFNILNNFSEEENHVIFPLISNGDVFGLLKIETNKKDFDKDYISIINISSKLLSGAINNYLLSEQMEISLNFYKAMKDIAKIIESQYDLSYIIPLIGEMIDRFMSSHLIYIFIKKEEEYKLVWPIACKDESVYKLIEQINSKTEYIMSDDSKIGVFPIVNEETILGAIVAYSNIDKLLQKDIDYLVQLTRQSGMTIHRANVYAEVLKYATLDALTGLNNRRQFEVRLKQEVSNSKRNNLPLCCMMLDVDYFKKVNDTYGHAAGDCVLKAVSEIIKTEIREYDIACRYGGEEFFIFLPQTNIHEAGLVAQRLRKVIEESKMDITEAKLENHQYLKVTVSIGVCKYDSSMSANAFAHKADKALYEAKTSGRNRVIVAQ